MFIAGWAYATDTLYCCKLDRMSSNQLKGINQTVLAMDFSSTRLSISIVLIEEHSAAIMWRAQ
jgi:hypothetical protein